MDQIRRPATPQPAAPTQRTQSTPPAQENQAPNAPSEPKTDTASQSLGDDVNAVAEQSKNIKSDDMNDGSAADAIKLGQFKRQMAGELQAILSDSNTNDTAQIKGLLARLTREIYGDDASKKVVDFLSKDKVRGPALNQELKDTIQNNKGNLEKLIDELSKKNKNLVNGQCDSGC
jgi:hypothetical protein